MRCQIEPLPEDQVAVEIDARRRVVWHFGPRYPRPFFYPLVGPSGRSVTRMGHPGAPNHDHHRSVWYAHQKLLGRNFWSDQSDTQIRQLQWLAYQEGPADATLAVRLGWFDGHDPAPLLEQELVASVRPGQEDAEETLLELQATFFPRAAELEFGQANFGFLAVRVAQRISAVFGGGELTDSEGRRTEKNIFGRRAVWMDYSSGLNDPHREGITYFDHPENPGYPSHWHVRADGWMGAATTFAQPLSVRRADPLILRHLLHVHRGGLDVRRARAQASEFADSPGFEVQKSTQPHRQYFIQRRQEP